MKIISALFHPLLMATYCSVLFYLMVPEIYSPIPLQSVPYFIGAIFMTTSVVPAMSILFLKLTKKVSNLEITKLEERSLPFLSIGAFYGVTTYMFYTKMRLPITLLVIMIAVTAMIFAIFLISLRFKISVHSAAVWGVAGLCSAFSMKYLSTDLIMPLAGLFLIAGLTTTSRLYLNRHTPDESWTGAIFGFVFCFVALFFFG